MGKEEVHVMNENGEILANMCSTNGLVIGGTLFKKNIRAYIKFTGIPQTTGIKNQNQIDHIIMNDKWRISLVDIRACRGADVNNDNSQAPTERGNRQQQAKKKDYRCQAFERT